MKKAKTVKEFKKSNKKLYNDLMRERTRHQQASKIIGHMKYEMNILNREVNSLHNYINKLRDEQNESIKNDEVIIDYTARILKKMG